MSLFYWPKSQTRWYRIKMWIKGIFWAICLCVSVSIQAEEPWSVADSHPLFTAKSAKKETSSTWLKWYQEYISSFDGPRCPMHPTCSRYAADSFRTYGFWIGFLMTVDRLMHEEDKRDSFRLVRHGQRWRYEDWPQYNRPWWHR